ncbi:MAG: hypothetical protein M3R43_09880 [Acidobacteriota bacterium]|nr:hypothetical protein [Acidobacteriota bacterium]
MKYAAPHPTQRWHQDYVLVITLHRNGRVNGSAQLRHSNAGKRLECARHKRR